MHELSVMDSALRTALEHAGKSSASRIHRIAMRIGDVSGVSIDALTFAFDILTQDTIAQGSELSIERVPASCRCRDCGHTFEPPGLLFECPLCRSVRADLTAGREIELSSMEVS